MCESLEGAIATLQSFVESFDPQALDRDRSKEMFDKFVLVERLGAAGKALTGLRAAETRPTCGGTVTVPRPTTWPTSPSAASAGRSTSWTPPS